MIHVSHLTKRFAGHIAVNDISFDVAPREIVGFLGPNGAGKTTTMRMLTGFLPPTGGRIEIDGFDVHRDPANVRKRIGYLPENCPLYPELRVDEYLRFRAALKGVPWRRRRARIAECKERCGLKDVGSRLIGQLSKGYRQRVGLAEALVHDPDVLILDEPTIGLDPNQMRQVRTLIESLSARHTILLSTHLLSEVDAICNRVLILHEGRMIAADPTSALKRKTAHQRLALEIKGSPDLPSRLAALPGVKEVHLDPRQDGWFRGELICAHEPDLRDTLFGLALEQQWAIRELHRREPSLEDVFVALTASGATRAGVKP
ncbi:MAG TPA: ATP-binding cassette domain-containing protein [Kiritimatiellia bacterium]|nr:ATP-binding cassette domain-containing protein [Kiritimatiellia bacterium]